ncbi:HIG1 domain family member 2A, mitochondrial isoform X2 [Diaphorina citri]|uniref:HIG1 domain family member 2A, mitochondrial isoform X1 n=1 Tax=Diaphorina citri TaxID=121845 RepID=A0A1S3CVH5_DIACI|nr:HIG1 domain family member 2A, mitochondrial isoform X1 [Diaphorina citri]XP_017298185.1 HIG1 domain family member 2A, mitochondrial isoform X1 [Diaphorina citri]XP_026677025.1 HIG1 domain family member 2A, mitochondrial isoform X2 [Diaphorina citri]KAI5705638.1 hypothetical protein M8J75_000494 [Diaphorina citri]KAI5740238.1 hypothetical protein M8J76_001990 [Diaphorina citri]
MANKITQQEQDELDWLTLQKKLQVGGYEQFTQETGTEKLIRKFKENPLVPIGCVATSAALGVGLYSMKLGDRRLSQMMMRTRVVAQGFTVLALTGGLIYTAYQT